jgi:tRNA threonylcarbamoyl adenosine modification protein YjeE
MQNQQNPDGARTGEASWVIDCPDLAATARLAAEIAGELRPNDLLTLTGDLGAGKTTFARALIRTLMADQELEVPSPTFTLMQIYDAPRVRIVHCDLYRVQSAEELTELGWDEAADGALVVVEWADRAGSALHPDRLDVAFIMEPEEGPEHRVAVVTGFGSWAQRVTIMKARERLLEQAGWAGARREHMQGDASTRAYERLHRQNDGTATAVLMISPPRADGPAIRYGKSYSTLARLAEDVRPFVAMAGALRERGFSAPEVLARDMRTGLLLLEDLGSEPVLVDGAPDPARYMAAVEALAALHAMELPSRLPLPDGSEHVIQGYEPDVMGIELELMLDWYLPYRGKSGLAASARGVFLHTWAAVLGEAMAERRTWTLRDYHSPNLIWLPEREGLARIGIIDFQDALMGHPAYDVVSLLQDARVDVDEMLEIRLLGHYARLRREADPGFDMAAFARAYAIMGAQRNTKILGIFARLNQRDGKPQYVAMLPRIERYVVRCLNHPVLADLKVWYETHVPGLMPPPEPAEDPAGTDAAAAPDAAAEPGPEAPPVPPGGAASQNP